MAFFIFNFNLKGAAEHERKYKADRKQLKNPNGLILGTSGIGKSFAAKREITNAFLITTDDILICDPEAEYAPLKGASHPHIAHKPPVRQSYGHKPEPFRRRKPYCPEKRLYPFLLRGCRRRTGRLAAH